MAETDTIPVDPDYAVARPMRSNVLRTRAAGGKEYRRIQAVPQKGFVLTWVRRSLADMQSLRDFFLKFGQDDFFDFDDKVEVRRYSCFAESDFESEEVGNEQHNCRIQILEAIGQNMNIYPSLPLGANISSKFQDVGTGKLITYAGYGFIITAAGATDMLLDGVSVGVVATKYNVAPNLHRFEVRPNTVNPTNFQAVI
jgi:hypothetical protein